MQNSPCRPCNLGLRPYPRSLQRYHLGSCCEYQRNGNLSRPCSHYHNNTVSVCTICKIYQLVGKSRIIHIGVRDDGHLNKTNSIMNTEQHKSSMHAIYVPEWTFHLSSSRFRTGSRDSRSSLEWGQCTRSSLPSRQILPR